jgi:hypothetical protein
MKWVWISLLGALAAGSGYAPRAWAAEPEPSAGNVFDTALLEANRRFLAGDLVGALEILEPVCSATERTECSFSLGAIQHGLGHCAEALQHYRRYRELAPEGSHDAEVAAALEEVEPRCGGVPGSLPVAGATAQTSADATTDRVAPGGAGPASAVALSSGNALPGASPASAPAPLQTGEPQLLAVPPASSPGVLAAGSLVLSGAAAASSVVFGILAARSASHCRHALAYDREFIDECEGRGPRYQALWQGFAVASGGLLGIGLTLWWVDANTLATPGVLGAGVPGVQYQGSF